MNLYKYYVNMYSNVNLVKSSFCKWVYVRKLKPNNWVGEDTYRGRIIQDYLRNRDQAKALSVDKEKWICP